LPKTLTSRSMTLAMLSAAAVTAQFVGGKATRDALFLTSLGLTALPAMLIATSVCSILLVIGHGRLASRVQLSTLVPLGFVLSGVFSLAEWLTRSAAPSTTAILVYLHVSGAGPLLASGFWLVISERFDPRSARAGLGQIAAAGTIGGIIGALLSERLAAFLGTPAMLLFLAGFQCLTAIPVWLLSRGSSRPRSAGIVTIAPPLRSGLQVVAEAPHLRRLAALVLLGTTSAALLEYAFKVKAVETLGPGDNLLRFFAVYYAATGLVTFALQALSTRTVLDKFGLALTASTPSIALLAGAVGSLASPGLGGLVVARGAEAVFRGSWFRTGYELFYTPLPSAEKRAAKSVIDVAFDRLGDAVGGGIVRMAIVFLPAAQSAVILGAAAASSVAAIVIASGLNRWYLRTLERSLVRQAVGLDLSQSRHDLGSIRLSLVRSRKASATDDSAGQETSVATAARTASLDPELQRILWLRSRDRDRIVDVLSDPEGLSAGLVAHVIPLLAWDAVAERASFALRKVAEERVGELADALLDPGRNDVVRRRLARIFAVCVSQRAADALAIALDDENFDIRFHAARSLAAILRKNPGVAVNRVRVYDVIMKEVAVSRTVWEGRRLQERAGSEPALNEFSRGDNSLAHVFTLLSLVLPAEPLHVAFRGLNTDDTHLRGTAFEYMDVVLPPAIRQRLWPLLVAPRVPLSTTAVVGVTGGEPPRAAKSTRDTSVPMRASVRLRRVH
jgi:ATP:ADP antiporter, AAA family